MERAFPVLEHLPFVSAAEAYGVMVQPPVGPPASAFTGSVPPVLILKADVEGSFLVSTEGNNYARYVCRLVRRAGVARDASMFGGAL